MTAIFLCCAAACLWFAAIACVRAARLEECRRQPLNRALWNLRTGHLRCFMNNDIPPLVAQSAAQVINCWAGGGKWAGAWWMFKRAIEGEKLSARVWLYGLCLRWFGYDPEGYLDDGAKGEDEMMRKEMRAR